MRCIVKPRFAKAQKRLESLLAEAEKMREHVGRSGGKANFPSVDLHQFLMSTLQGLRYLCEKDSHYYQAFENMHARYLETGGVSMDQCVGTLRALLSDIEVGMFGDIVHLVTADVFADVLESADYLLDQGYHLPGIALAGAVLEQALRKIAQEHGVSWTGDSAISKITMALYKAGCLDKVQMGQIEAWGKLRNKVDHGDFKEPGDVAQNDALRMLQGVRDFVQANFAGKLGTNSVA
jgi:hypothetical protein